MKSYRDTFEKSIIGEITQGSIFNGAISKLYLDKKIEGLVITPRCDIAQKKVSEYYYLPIVNYKDWLEVEFPALFLSKLKKDTYGKLRKCLRLHGVSDSILNIYNSIKVRQLAGNVIGEKIPKDLNQLFNKLSDIELIDSNIEKAKEYYEKYTSIKKSILDEIISNKNSNFYVIENEKDVFVIRIRELRRLTNSMLFKLASGIEHPLSEEELKENDIRQLEEGDIYYPIFTIKSPYIEHIVQHFMQQFNRIGVEDMCDATIKRIKDF